LSEHSCNASAPALQLGAETLRDRRASAYSRCRQCSPPTVISDVDIQ